MKTINENKMNAQDKKYPTLGDLRKFKGFNGNVYPYLIECVNDSSYFTDEPNLKSENIKDNLQFVADHFYSEYLKHDNQWQKRCGNYQNALAEWFMGLPSAISIDFEYYRIIEIAKEWESIPQNATDKQEDKICAAWFKFLACKLVQLFNKYDIEIKS